MVANLPMPPRSSTGSIGSRLSRTASAWSGRSRTGVPAWCRWAPVRTTPPRRRTARYDDGSPSAGQRQLRRQVRRMDRLQRVRRARQRGVGRHRAHPGDHSGSWGTLVETPDVIGRLAVNQTPIEPRYWALQQVGQEFVSAASPGGPPSWKRHGRPSQPVPQHHRFGRPLRPIPLRRLVP